MRHDFLTSHDRWNNVGLGAHGCLCMERTLRFKRAHPYLYSAVQRYRPPALSCSCLCINSHIIPITHNKHHLPCGVNHLEHSESHGPGSNFSLSLLSTTLPPPFLHNAPTNIGRTSTTKQSPKHQTSSPSQPSTMSTFSDREVQLMACAFQAMKAPPEVRCRQPPNPTILTSHHHHHHHYHSHSHYHHHLPPHHQLKTGSTKKKKFSHTHTPM